MYFVQKSTFFQGVGPGFLVKNDQNFEVGTFHLFMSLGISRLRLLRQMASYGKTIHRRTASDFSNRLVTEAYARLTNDDLQLYENSAPVKDAVKLLGKAEDGHELFLNEFTMVWDYLMTQIIIDNGSRPGPIQNAKVSRFKIAIPNSTKTIYIMLVEDHKTTDR